MPSLSSEPAVPEVLLRSGPTSYEFVRTLGAARNGELVLARRRYDEGFGGLSIIKRPLPPVSEEARRRLVDEARVSSQLHHPNLLTMLQLKGPDGMPHLILEHVPGYRLDVLLEASEHSRQPLSEGFACHVVAEIADALHHAHTLVDEHGRDLGIVHRDVTPHNILLGEHGEVKLLDFGAAWSRLAGRVSSEGPAVQGSLAYAAPEHVHHLSLDGRADQFSLGIVLLQLLTGRHLFEGAESFDARQRQPPVAEDAVTRLCAHELAERIRNYTVTDLEAATRAVPEALRAIVHRMLSPERTGRFPSCASLSRALREYLRETEQPFGRHEVLAELVSLRYVALRVAAGETPDDAVNDRLLPEPPSPRSAPRSVAHHRAARMRGTPRRR
ncbi:serine/threonine protein kinase [Hyalangium versicolor]|uniref:serine/threonine protein kinase n=1 Tax=Hyalangium versicolor TaxID=2861190 RepID=UPI001CCA82FC|nr:serine/threonine-protein kinase [Hyalangium versicolor]